MTIQAAFDQAAADAAMRLYNQLTEESEKLHVEHGAEPRSAMRVILSALKDVVAEDLPRDGRACLWRARLRLFDSSRLSSADPVADSDPERSAELPGMAVFVSLPAIAEWLAELAAVHHGRPCSGLDSATLKRKLASLRTQLSNRGDGTAVWRLPYTTMPVGLQQPFQGLARCDIIRESEVRR